MREVNIDHRLNWPLDNVDHRWSWSRFWYGCAGGVAVEVVRLLKALPNDALFQSPRLFLYILISLAMVVMGGVFASSWEADRPIKSLYLGATLPFWMSTWAHLIVH